MTVLEAGARLGGQLKTDASLGAQRLITKLLKPIFYEEALHLLQKKGAPASNSALDLFADLHRCAIRQFQAELGGSTSPEVVIPIMHQVLANWLFAGQQSIAVANFTGLVINTQKAVSGGFSPALILQDMVRQALVSPSNGQVNCSAIGASAHGGRSQAIQHISAGLHNLQATDVNQFLEQSSKLTVYATPQSRSYTPRPPSNGRNFCKACFPQPKPCATKTNPQGGTHRMRVGVYLYAELTPSDYRARWNPSPLPPISVSTKVRGDHEQQHNFHHHRSSKRSAGSSSQRRRCQWLWQRTARVRANPSHHP